MTTAAIKATAEAGEFKTFAQRAVIKVCGIGGGGGNAVGRMIEAGLEDVEFIVVNTDAQDLRRSPAPLRIQIGDEVTGGLGAGAKPEIGRKAAEEDRERIQEVLEGADMVFLTAGLGGGTGTGASPLVANIARETGALTVAIVTLPFEFEGVNRRDNALAGLQELEQHVDALIVVPNDRLAKLTPGLPFSHAFEQADEVLYKGVRAITEIIAMAGSINVDFADVETIVRGGGRALMGIGRAEGEDRAKRAAEEAIVCPLLEQATIEGAKGVIVNVIGGCNVLMQEVLDALSIVRRAADPGANIIFGIGLSPEEQEELQVTVIAAKFPESASSLSASERIGDRAWEDELLGRKPEAKPAAPAVAVAAPAPAVAALSQAKAPFSPAAKAPAPKPALQALPDAKRKTPPLAKPGKKQGPGGQLLLLDSDPGPDEAGANEAPDFDTPAVVRGGKPKRLPRFMETRRRFNRP